jgi:hypothetical protein
MTIKDFLEGLSILRPYYENPDGYHLGAEHDVIYIYATDFPLEAEHVKQLCDLGFCQEDAEVPDDKDFGPEYYNPEEGWAAYV